MARSASAKPECVSNHARRRSNGILASLAAQSVVLFEVAGSSFKVGQELANYQNLSFRNAQKGWVRNL